MGKKDSALQNIKDGKGLKPIPDKNKGKTTGVAVITSEDQPGISYLKHSLDEAVKKRK